MIDGQGLIALINAMGAAIIANKDRLCALDGVIGDGDHGVTMEIGFTAVSEALAALPPESDPTAVFNAAAKSFLNAVGASAGPLYATAFMRAGAAVKGKAALDRDAMIAALIAMATGVQDRGKAVVGEKTMVDAWAPAATAVAAARDAGQDLSQALDAAARAAAAGAEATAGMVATKGRSARLGERSLGHVDAGAASTALMLDALAQAVAARAAV
ncbi:MAG: dihydroxyacetone kinase subunit DhaL [Labrys sp. (in: a-proteobacteria)]|jgi:dihydroxyacetone kinase-like protein